MNTETTNSDTNVESGNGRKPDDNEVDIESNEGSEDTIVIDTENDDLTVETTAEINVEKLVAKIESADPRDIERQRAVKRRLDEVSEARDDDLDSTYNINLDDDL